MLESKERLANLDEMAKQGMTKEQRERFRKKPYDLGGDVSQIIRKMKHKDWESHIMNRFERVE